MINFYYVGRIVSRQKNFHKFYELINILISNNFEFCFTIFGKGDDILLNQLKKRSSNIFRIINHGYDNNWIKFIPENAIQIFLSDYEGCPLALLESYKNDKKNIAVINSPGLFHYVSNNCVFDNINQLANSLINNQDLYNYKDLSEFFDQERHTKEVINCFNSIQ